MGGGGRRGAGRKGKRGGRGGVEKGTERGRRMGRVGKESVRQRKGVAKAQVDEETQTSETYSRRKAVFPSPKLRS